MSSDECCREDIAAAPGLGLVFNAIDKDRKGKISADDLRSLLSESTSDNLSDADADTMISVADKNKNGFVELDELAQVLGCQQWSPREWIMKDMFRIMDMDGDGKVGFQDLRNFMDQAGIPVTDQDIREMIMMGGSDDNDGVPYNHLMKILALNG